MDKRKQLFSSRGADWSVYKIVHSKEQNHFSPLICADEHGSKIHLATNTHECTRIQKQQFNHRDHGEHREEPKHFDRLICADEHGSNKKGKPQRSPFGIRLEGRLRNTKENQAHFTAEAQRRGENPAKPFAADLRGTTLINRCSSNRIFAAREEFRERWYRGSQGPM